MNNPAVEPATYLDATRTAAAAAMRADLEPAAPSLSDRVRAHMALPKAERAEKEEVGIRWIADLVRARLDAGEADHEGITQAGLDHILNGRASPSFLDWYYKVYSCICETDLQRMTEAWSALSERDRMALILLAGADDADPRAPMLNISSQNKNKIYNAIAELGGGRYQQLFLAMHGVREYAIWKRKKADALASLQRGAA
jgi:hypothetical protein